MTSNKLTLTGLSLLFTIAAFLVGAGDVSAQGRYVGQLSRNDVDSIIRRMEDSGDEFNRDFRRELSNSNLSSSQKRTYNNQSNAFENATDRLRSNFNNQNSWWESRSQVQNVISNARPLNQTMLSIGFRRNVERQWNRLRDDVNKLADTYDLPGIAGGGWSGGPWNPGNPGGGGNVPSWAQGTFYARNPQNGGTIRMDVQRNGRVTLTYDGGSPAYASMNGTLLTNGPYQSRVSRINNGIRTTSTSNNDRIDYFRTPPGPGWGGGGGGNIPNWALGTFYARNPQNGGTIQMDISNNGTVVLRYDGGAPNYASLNGTLLTNGPYQSRVTRINGGIRTTSTSNNDFIDYYKRRPW